MHTHTTTLRIHLMTCALRVCTLVVCMSLWNHQTHAQTSPKTKTLPFPEISRAIACYGNFNYTCTLEILSVFPSLYPASNPNTIIDPNPTPSTNDPNIDVSLEVGRILGVSYLATNQPEKAKEVFHWVLSVRPSFSLEGPEVPPEYRRVFLEVRAQRTAPFYAAYIHAQTKSLARGMRTTLNATQRTNLVAVLPKQTTQDPSKPWTSHPRISTRWVTFIGPDRDRFQDGVGASIGWDMFAPEEPWGIGFDAQYSNHAIETENLVTSSLTRLNITHLSILALWRSRETAPWQLGAHAGAGGTMLGFNAFAQSAVPNLQTGVDAQWALTTRLSLRATSTLRALIIDVQDGGKIAWSPSTGIGLEGSF